MTYFMRRSKKRNGAIHICSDEFSLIEGPVFSICACDGLEHLEFELIQKGVNHGLITCKECMKKLAGIVKKEIREILAGL